MVALKTYYRKLDQIPAAVKSFLIKGFLFFIAWKLIYLLWLYPSRILDKPLTRFTANGAVKTLNILSNSSNFTAVDEIAEYNSDGVHELKPLSSIFFKGEKVLSVADVCNALELFVLYAGFIVCFPASLKKKLLFIPGGIITICLINILRCAGLVWIFIHYPEYGDFSHHFVFTFIVYLFIFLLWYWFSKNKNADVKA